MDGHLLTLSVNFTIYRGNMKPKPLKFVKVYNLSLSYLLGQNGLYV